MRQFTDEAEARTILDIHWVGGKEYITERAEMYDRRNKCMIEYERITPRSFFDKNLMHPSQGMQYVVENPWCVSQGSDSVLDFKRWVAVQALEV